MKTHTLLKRKPVKPAAGARPGRSIPSYSPVYPTEHDSTNPAIPTIGPSPAAPDTFASGGGGDYSGAGASGSWGSDSSSSDSSSASDSGSSSGSD
jgi:hypothetical protein